MTDYEALISEVADLARRIGPARTPEDIRDRLEDIVAKHRKRAEINRQRSDGDMDERYERLTDMVVGRAREQRDEARAEAARLREALECLLAFIDGDRGIANPYPPIVAARDALNAAPAAGSPK